MCQVILCSDIAITVCLFFFFGCLKKKPSFSLHHFHENGKTLMGPFLHGERGGYSEKKNYWITIKRTHTIVLMVGEIYST